MDYMNYIGIVKIGIIAVFTIAVSKKCIILTMELLRDAGCILVNYRGIKVVFGMGIAFLPIIISALSLSLLFFKEEALNYICYLFAVCAIGFAGLLDDLIGDKHIKGIKNHFVSFFKGKLTTGFAKAFIGFSASFALSIIISSNTVNLLLNLFNISLFSNAANLMDLRPGRCTKIFLLVSFALLLANMDSIVTLLPLLVMFIAALIYIRYDLNEFCMLGDTGSNIFGITLGYFSSIIFDSIGKTIILTILLFLNIAAEKVSITEIISKNRLLNFLDNLGRSSR